MKQTSYLTVPRSGSALRRPFLIAIGLLALVVALLPALSASAAPPDTFPTVIPLPDGFQPEGIAVGRDHSLYVGSLWDGRIYKGDLRSGQGDILVPTQQNRIAVGLAVDLRSNYLFVAGGWFGAGHVYDAATGDPVADFQFTSEPSFVNDVVVTRDAAYFTDSSRAFLYQVPLGRGGAIPASAGFESIPLSGDFELEPGFNANGIEATPDGGTLFIAQSNTGTIFRVDPESGVATRIVAEGTLPSGDGLVLDGTTLYVVQNFLNQIGVVQLSPDLSAGEVVDVIADPNFRIPTTAAEFGKSLYAVNARFDVAPPPGPHPNTEFEVVQVSKP